MEVKVKVKAFLAQFFGDYELKDNDDIFSSGHVNSLFAMQLITFLENEFKIKIGNEDLDLSNFYTLDAIEMFVTKKQ